MSINTALGNKGQCHKFEHNGKEYTVSYLTQEVKAAMETHLQDKALNLLLKLKGKIPANEWEIKLDKFTEEVVSGEYDFHSELAEKVITKPGGALVLASKLFGIHESAMADLIVERGDDIQALLKVIIAQSAPKKKPKVGNE